MRKNKIVTTILVISTIIATIIDIKFERNLLDYLFVIQSFLISSVMIFVLKKRRFAKNKKNIFYILYFIFCIIFSIFNLIIHNNKFQSISNYIYYIITIITSIICNLDNDIIKNKTSKMTDQNNDENNC